MHLEIDLKANSLNWTLQKLFFSANTEWVLVFS